MADRLRSGDVSSRDLTEAHLDLAERQNTALNAWLSIDRDRALGEADAADARIAAARAEGSAALRDLHPMFGIPVALKTWQEVNELATRLGVAPPRDIAA